MALNLDYEPDILVEDITQLTEAEWLAWRTKGIGGSDVAAVLGILNEYKEKDRAAALSFSCSTGGIHMNATEVKNIQVPHIPQRCAGAIFRAQSVKYLIRALVDKERALLVIAFYARESVCKGERDPEIVLYQSKTDYLTRCKKDGKTVWRTGCLTSVMYWDTIEASVFLTKREEELAAAFIGKRNSDESVLRSLTGLQEQIKSERLKARHDHMIAKIDRRMTTVPDLPAGFMRWVDRTPLKRSRYLFLHRVTRKKWTGICTHCGADVDLTKARHNEDAVCPVCGTHATIKTRSKMENTVDIEYASLLQKSLAGEVVLRLFHLTRTFSTDRRKTSCIEYGRFFFDANGKPTGSYKWKRFKSTDIMRWSEATRTDWEPYQSNPFTRLPGLSALPLGNQQGVVRDAISVFCKGSDS